MQFPLIINSNLVPFAGLIFMLIFTCINPLLEKRQTKLFLVAIIVNMVMIVAISADYIFTNNGENMWEWRRVTSFLNFAACPVVPFLLFSIFQETKVKKTYYIPLIVNAVLCFISIFVNVVFSISETNAYGRGPLFFVPFLTAIIYIIIMIIKPAARHAHSKRFERVFLLSIIALLVVCMVFEIVFGLFFLSWDCSVLGLFLYYLLLTMFSYIVDPLTGVYNRLMYARELSRLGSNAHYFIAILDINDFKLVNDLYGHDEGDLYLSRFADTVKRRLLSGATLYRIGGDEFAVISKNPEVSRLEASLKTALTDMRESGMSFAWGIAEFSAGDNFDDVFKQADERMYQNKKDMKACS